jgi:O-antigen/teichoic acid export membrane protein
MLYLAKGGFWLTFGQGIAMLSGLFISIAFANLFPKESFGTYKFILSGVAILGVFSITGLSTSIIQSVARGFEGSLQKGFWLNLKWSIGVFLGGLTISLYYYLNGNQLLSFSFLLAGICTPLTSSASLYSAYILGKKDFKKSSFYGMVRNTIPAIVLVITLLISQSLPVIITVYFLVGLIVPVFLYIKIVSTNTTKSTQEDPDLLVYSKHLSIMDIIASLAHYLDKILIFHYLGAAPLAIYAFAIAPVEQLQGGKKILSTLILPKLSERPFEELQKSAPRKAFLLTIYALTLAGTYAFFAPYFYSFLYPQYLDSVFYSQIYSLTLLAVSGTIFNETLIAHRKTKELYFHRTIVPITQVILFFILLPIYGLMGLIITHVIMRSFSTLLAFYFVKHPFSNKIPNNVLHI